VVLVTKLPPQNTLYETIMTLKRIFTYCNMEQKGVYTYHIEK